MTIVFIIAVAFVSAAVGYFAHAVTSSWSLQSAYECGVHDGRCDEGRQP
jgi:hypothetical protein